MWGVCVYVLLLLFKVHFLFVCLLACLASLLVCLLRVFWGRGVYFILL